MSREKQIEEMKVDLFNSVVWKDLEDGVTALDVDSTTEKLHYQGYRRQSDNTVEVVRCKDCFFGDVDTTGSGSVQCQNRDVPWRRYKEEFVMRPHDYCSYARAKMKGGAE